MQLPNKLVNSLPDDYANKMIALKSGSVATNLKAADSAARARSLSIQERATADATDTLGMAGFNWMVHAGELVSPWWSPSRDKDLRDFWKKSNHLAGALASFIARISTMRFRVLPVDKAVKLQISMASEFEESLLNNVEFGAGWNVFVEKCTADLIGADNGFFAEIIGPGDPTGPILGRAVSLAHLDSSRCQRTSSPEFPVVYRDTDGKRYKLHYTRVMYASQMPSSNADMRGVGFCAISRCIDIAQNLQDICRYKQEKLGSRPPRIMILGKKNITASDIFSAFYAAEEMMDSQNLARYSKIVVVAPKRGFGELDLEIKDLASFPDGFDEEQSITLGMFAIALALGVDARELWPATVSGATKADAMIQHLKARGKGIGQTLQTFQRQINQKFLPRTLWFEFDQQDDEQDMVQAEVRDMRSIRHERDLTSGTVDIRTAREQMLDKGDLTPAQFERMELEDGRLPDGASILTLFYSEDEEIKQYLSDVGDPKTMLERDIDSALNTAINGALEAIAHLPRDSQRGKARQALAALEFVKEERENEAAEAEAEDGSRVQIRNNDNGDVDGRTTQPVNRPEYRAESESEVVRRLHTE